MSKESSFTAWAISRAEAIVEEQGLELLRARDCQSKPAREHHILRLTMAIIEALIDARNFRPRQEDADRPKSH